MRRRFIFASEEKEEKSTDNHAIGDIHRRSLKEENIVHCCVVLYAVEEVGDGARYDKKECGCSRRISTKGESE